MKNRIILVLLAGLLAVGLLGTGARVARADDTVYTEGTLYYTITNESITITGCFGKNEEIHVPAMIAGIPVNTIASGAFAENQYVKKVYLPDTISKVEPGAFGDWVKVIYNANTDHPQDTPTDLILSNMDPEPIEQSTTKPTTTQDPGDATPGTVIGETDVNDDDDETSAPTEAPTAEPVAEATTAPATAEPVAEASSAPVENETATAAPVKPENPGEPEKPGSPDQPKNLIWFWVTLGVAIVAGGITTGIAVSNKAKKKES